MDDYDLVLRHLCEASVTRPSSAYTSIAWDAEGNVVRPDDPRWILGELDPLGATDWYRTLPASTQAEIGLYRACEALEAGIEFEAVLQEGLLRLANRLPTSSWELRYVYHEVAEEAQHSLMFAEFVRRAKVVVDVRGAHTWVDA